MNGLQRDGREDELQDLGETEAELPAHAEARDASPLQAGLKQTKHQQTTLLAEYSRSYYVHISTSLNVNWPIRCRLTIDLIGIDNS